VEPIAMVEAPPGPRASKRAHGFLAAVCIAAVLGPVAGLTFAQEKAVAPSPSARPDSTASAKADTAAAKLPPEQLESLVAPVALYPDALLAQTLVASTYPLEIVQLQQWLAKHKDLKDKALADAVAKEPWDPSIQSMAAIPEVVDRLANDIQWTTDLGNAFLAQQSDVMDAVQRMRKKAQDSGALKSNEQQKVETTVVEEKTVIIVESADPEVIYVPSYSPTVVYGAPLYYPYPPIYYPPYYGGAFIGFSMGVMWGAAWGGSCCGCGWGGNNVNINVDNNFNHISHNDGRGEGGRGEGGRGEGGRGDGGRGQGGSQGGNWKHNPQHRGAAPYGDKATANKYGGSARGDSPANRAGASNRAAGGAAGSPGVSNRAGGAAGGAGASNRAGAGGSPGVNNRAAGGAGGSAGMSKGGGGDQIGNRSIPSQSGSKGGNSGFSGGSRGYSGSSARTSSSRGSSSMRGGGGGRGGGGRGGGRR
jgi:uncharacterized protein DUF3300